MTRPSPLTRLRRGGSIPARRSPLPSVVLLAVLCATMASGAAPGDTRLVDAARAGNLVEVRQLLERRVPVNAAAADGTTALHWAVRSDRRELAQLLLRAGAQVNAATRYGITPLSLAAVNGSTPMLELLLEAGADVNGASGEGEPVLMTAARTGRIDAVRLLLARGARVNATEPWQGETALMWAAGENHADVVALLAASGADLDVHATVPDLPKVKQDFSTMAFTAIPRGGFTATMFAARQGALEATRALIDAGAALNEVDPDGTSALVVAIINAHYDIASLLIERGADVNLADAAGMTPLYAAVDMEHLEPLLNRPSRKPSGRLRPLDVIGSLLAHGADANLALKTPLLMRQHNFGDASLGEGATPLMRAAKVSDAALMRRLLDGGADAAARMKNNTTALMITASRPGRAAGEETQTIDALALLLDRGADVTAVNDNGETALHLAVGRGDGIVRYLVGRGASLDARDKSGRTPLDVALGKPSATGGRGRGGQAPEPPPVRESTAALLRELAAQRTSDQQ